MKAFLLSFSLLLGCIVYSVSSTAQKKPVKATIEVPGAQDEWCKEHIENYLKREYGIISAVVNYHRHYIRVQFVPDRTNIENIKTAIANLGYDADDVTKNEESFQRLPIDHRHKVVVAESN